MDPQKCCAENSSNTHENMLLETRMPLVFTLLIYRSPLQNDVSQAVMHRSDLCLPVSPLSQNAERNTCHYKYKVHRGSMTIYTSTVNLLISQVHM